MASMYIYGIHSVTQALRCHPECVLEIWIHKDHANSDLKAIQSLASQHQISITRCDNSFLNKNAGSNHQGVMARRRQIQPAPESQLEHFDGLSRKDILLLALDGIQDPQNFGACLRTAAAADVDAVITPKKSTVPINATVHKTSSGTAEWITWFQVGNMVRQLEKLKQQGIWIIGTDQNAENSLFDTDLTGPVLLLMGSEGKGLRLLRKQTCDMLINIPMDTKVESLNVSVATGICLYQILQQRKYKKN